MQVSCSSVHLDKMQLKQPAKQPVSHPFRHLTVLIMQPEEKQTCCHSLANRQLLLQSLCFYFLALFYATLTNQHDRMPRIKMRTLISEYTEASSSSGNNCQGSSQQPTPARLETQTDDQPKQSIASSENNQQKLKNNNGGRSNNILYNILN